MTEWNTEKCLQLIDEFQKFPVLWDPKDSLYYSKNKKADAYEIISQRLNVSGSDARQKMNSLLGSFRREKAKGKKTVGTGTAAKDVYISKWFGFKRMSFLLDRDEPRGNIDTCETDESQIGDDDSTSNADDITDNSLQYDELSQTLSDNTSASEENFSRPEAVSSGKKRKAKRGTFTQQEDSRLEEAFKILKEAASAGPEDACSAYAKYVGEKLRTYNSRTRAIIQHEMNNILFNADMGKYDIPPVPAPAHPHEELNYSNYTVFPSSSTTSSLTYATL